MKIEKLEYYSSSKEGYIWERHPNIEDITDKINEIIDKLNERNNAEPVKHGKWLFEEYPDGYYHSKCSLCNSWFSEDAFLNPYKYCPNCGACMIKQGDITTEQGDITTKRLDIPTMDEVNDEAN